MLPLYGKTVRHTGMPQRVMLQYEHVRMYHIIDIAVIFTGETNTTYVYQVLNAFYH